MKIVLSALGYLLVVFPLAFVWHLVLFAETYQTLGYFGREEPIVAFGFGAVLLQGALLGCIYPFLCRGCGLLSGAVRLALVMGGYHWTMHVLAAAAKYEIAPLPTWFALESAYLAIQFFLGGLVIAFIHRAPADTLNKSSGNNG